MNQFNGVGRITKDGDLRFAAGSGNAVLKFSIAIDRRFKKEGQKEVDFFNCIMFGKYAESIAPYILKGKLISVTGSLQTGNYEKDGIKRYTTDIVVNELKLLEKKSYDSTTPQDTGNGEGITPIDDSESEIPF